MLPAYQNRDSDINLQQDIADSTNRVFNVSDQNKLFQRKQIDNEAIAMDKFLQNSAFSDDSDEEDCPSVTQSFGNSNIITRKEVSFMPLMDTKKKIRKLKNEPDIKVRGYYSKPTNLQRETLIALVQDGQSICSAANQTGIKYTTARNIIESWRKTGRLYRSMPDQKRAQLLMNPLGRQDEMVYMPNQQIDPIISPKVNLPMPKKPDEPDAKAIQEELALAVTTTHADTMHQLAQNKQPLPEPLCTDLTSDAQMQKLKKLEALSSVLKVVAAALNSPKNKH